MAHLALSDSYSTLIRFPTFCGRGCGKPCTRDSTYAQELAIDCCVFIELLQWCTSQYLVRNCFWFECMFASYSIFCFRVFWLSINKNRKPLFLIRDLEAIILSSMLLLVLLRLLLLPRMGKPWGPLDLLCISGFPGSPCFWVSYPS